MSVSSRDHYGGHAADYRKFRPTYPESLFIQLLALVPHRKLHWDCGTGSGQVAVRLAEDFDRVWATDLSEKQLREAEAHPRVEYHQAEAHHSGLPDCSVALVTVATAVHWFDQASFYEEVQRVLSPEGVLAVWTYGPDLVAPEPLARVVRALSDRLDEDWPTGIEWVKGSYKDLPFPFPTLGLEPLEFRLNWTVDDLFGWISTWSAVHRHRARTGEEPLADVRADLEKVWPHDPGKPASIVFPLHYKVGRKE